MAKIKRKKLSSRGSSSRKPSHKNTVSLPTKKNAPITNIRDFTWLIYGEKKIGKTSLTSQFPNALIFSFEPGTKGLEVFAVSIPDWQTALDYSEKLFTDEHKFKNIVIDTGKIAYDRCLQYTCEKENISHPGDQNDYGKSWNTLNKNFERFHLDIVNNGLGMVSVAHEKVVETKSHIGIPETKIVPDLSGSSLGFYQGYVDIIARYHYIGQKRFLTIRGNENEVAGCRMKNNFLTPSGEKIIRIPMGNSEEEAYSNLEKAFNNQQSKTYSEVNVSKKKKRRR